MDSAHNRNWTLYEKLGVSSDASKQEIRRAHRELFRQLHPDRYSGPYQDHFDGLLQEINAARDILLDPIKRAAYDAAPTMNTDTGGRPHETSASERPEPGTSAGADHGQDTEDRGSNRQEQEEGPWREFAREKTGEEAARSYTKRAAAGEYGALRRILYSIPEDAQRVSLYLLAGWLWLGAAFLLWRAGRDFAKVAVVAGALVAPLVTYRRYKRLRSLTTRVDWSGTGSGPPRIHSWPGFAPYNKSWWHRTLLEAAYSGPLIFLLVWLVSVLHLLPYSAGALVMDALIVAGAVAGLVVTLWAVVGLDALLARPRPSGDPEHQARGRGNPRGANR